MILRFDGPEGGPLWGLPPGEEVLVRPPGTSMTFADFVRLLRAQNMKETFYLEYMAVHQYLGRPLQVRWVSRGPSVFPGIPLVFSEGLVAPEARVASSRGHRTAAGVECAL